MLLVSPVEICGFHGCRLVAISLHQRWDVISLDSVEVQYGGVIRYHLAAAIHWM